MKIPAYPHQGWASLMAPYSHELQAIWERVTTMCPAQMLAPPVTEVLAAFTMAPEEVKLVIVGQDPYPGEGLATGRAFEIPSDAPMPPTLRNIGIEYESDVGRPFRVSMMSSWVDQGVLLLNRVLTAQVGETLSHGSLGWDAYTESLLRQLLGVRDDVIAILWGARAQQLRWIFRSDLVIASPHPSPLSAYRGFFGSAPFTSANVLLRKLGRAPIEW